MSNRRDPQHVHGPNCRCDPVLNQAAGELPEAEVVADPAVGEALNIPTRVNYVPMPTTVPGPLMLDMGEDMAIVIQPMQDQADGELALNVVVGGGIDVEVVAWILGQASEALARGVLRAKAEEDKRR